MLAEVLASIICQTSSKETKILSETQDSDRIDCFKEQPVSTDDSIIIDLRILHKPQKLVTAWYLSFKNFHSGSVKQILWCLRNIKRLLCIFLSIQELSFL